MTAAPQPLSTASDRLAAQAVIGRRPANRRTQSPVSRSYKFADSSSRGVQSILELLRQHILCYASLQLQIQLYLTMSDKNNSSRSKGKAKEKKNLPAAKG